MAKMTEMQPIHVYNNNGLEYLNSLWAAIKALYMVLIYMQTPQVLRMNWLCFD